MRRLTESSFREKPGIEPATPGLQDIGLSFTPWRLHKLLNPFILKWSVAFSYVLVKLFVIRIHIAILNMTLFFCLW